MKKFLIAAAIMFSAACICQPAHAQMDNAVKKSLTVYNASLTVAKTSLTGSADTAIAKVVIDNTVLAVEGIGLKTGGTVAAKIYLVGYDIKGTNSVRLDSLVLTDKAGDQWKQFAIPDRTGYSKYELHFISTGGTWSPSAYNIRRP